MLADTEFDLTKSAMVTHFGFMKKNNGTVAPTTTYSVPKNNEDGNKKNRTNKNVEKNENYDNETISSNQDEDENSSIEAAKARFPIEEGSSRDESGSLEDGFSRGDRSLNDDDDDQNSKRLTGDDDDDDDDYRHDHRYHSDDEILEHRNRNNHHKNIDDHNINVSRDDDDDDNDMLRMPKIGSQFKARSTPNVPLSTNPNENYDNDNNDVPDEDSYDNDTDRHPQQQQKQKRETAPMKKGGILLEPLAKPRTSSSSRQRKKKKKGLQDRINELKALDNDNSSPSNGRHNPRRKSRLADNDDGEYLSTSLPPVLRGDKGYSRKMKNVFKPDQISLASFSSTANEGLYPEEIVVKHLAFRQSDLTVSTQIERYKVWFVP